MAVIDKCTYIVLSKLYSQREISRKIFVNSPKMSFATDEISLHNLQKMIKDSDILMGVVTYLRDNKYILTNGSNGHICISILGAAVFEAEMKNRISQTGYLLD